MESKPKRVMSEEALAKLAIAREKANAKRKELAAQRNEEKEQLVQEKLEASKIERAAKVNASAEKEAKRRISLDAERPAQDAERPRAVAEPGIPELCDQGSSIALGSEATASKAKQKTKRESIVIERDESDSSEDDVRDARVYFVRKNKDRSMPQVVAPPEIRPKTPDPLDGIYRQMFGGSSNFI